MFSRLFHQYSCNSEVETTWKSLICWWHRTSIGQPFVESLKKKNVGNFCIFSPWGILTNFLTGIRHLTLHWRLQFHSNPLSVKNRLIWHFQRQLWLTIFFLNALTIFFSKWCLDDQLLWTLWGFMLSQTTRSENVPGFCLRSCNWDIIF